MPTTDEPLCGCHRGPNVERGKWYGVRSYLHLFYEDCTGASLDDDLEESPPGPATPGWTSVLWKVSFSAGSLLLLVGAAALATGSLLPHKLERIGEAEFLVLDQEAAEYNHALGVCRAVGLALCALGAALLVTCLLSSGLSKMSPWVQRGEEEAGKEDQISPILAREASSRRWGTLLEGPPVPFRASWAQRIQPSRDP
nr:neurensin-2 [Pogona vitticeps]XP_020670319.1 neurensin-2 [Pogona vitticeps]